MVVPFAGQSGAKSRQVGEAAVPMASGSVQSAQGSRTSRHLRPCITALHSPTFLVCMGSRAHARLWAPHKQQPQQQPCKQTETAATTMNPTLDQPKHAPGSHDAS
jgi:hypothetical protein